MKPHTAHNPRALEEPHLKQPTYLKSISESSPARNLLLCGLILILTGCSHLPNMPLWQKPPAGKSEKIQRFVIGSNIAFLKWTQSEQQLYEELIKQFPQRRDYSVALQKHQSQQKKVTAKLSDNCHRLTPETQFFLVHQCVTTLSSVPLTDAQQQQLTQMQAALQKVEIALTDSIRTIRSHQPDKITAQEAPPQDITSQQLDNILTSHQQAITSGDLLTAKVIHQTLLEQPQLSSKQLKRLQAQHVIFKQKVRILDQYADQLYQQKSVAEAQAIWSLLLKLNETPELLNKQLRAKKVLENLRELRQDGHILNPTTDQSRN